MRKINLSVLLFLIAVLSVAQGRNSICRLGFTYEISGNPHWGLNKPVVNRVTPYSPAESAGIKVDDIIEEIDGIPIAQIAVDEIPMLLNPSGNNEVVIGVRNMTSPLKKVLISKQCKPQNAISEDQLASAYNMYSLETTTEREFICPFTTTTTEDAFDFDQIKTFSFAPIEESNRNLETVINGVVEKVLIEKGLKVDNDQPDMLIESYYMFNANPNYVGENKILVDKEASFRYDFTQNKMVKLPFLSYFAAEAEAAYLLQLGLRFIDQRELPGRVLWECIANEKLEEPFRLEEYALLHIPLMFMQYPYVKYGQYLPISVNKKSYNYTGISYNIDRLEQVLDVDRSSPAYAAGIRPGDIIERIGSNAMNHSAEAFSDGYKKFIEKTMIYRDPETIYTDINGFRYCMYWDTNKYPLVTTAIEKSEFRTAFSYLYYFTPYVNPAGNNACTFHIARGKNKMEVIIRPTIRTELTIGIN
ncbi:PDZ domain-containing protein [Parabacteroides sp. PF5-9]|uniref:PDZ domain-containing protein n=1 Tax=Parabacteroides sp. PF5-9 TaxID=1742404 RepID=UPI002472FCDC|nr:PDZ domain-containing protein [Parabacteroides sp. PF5-9]MDH6358530.1 hypothetical protein [Parabacteroides sp. PF5-9]